jgi:hypothetical protein
VAGPFIVLGPLTEFSMCLFSTQQSSSKVDVLVLLYVVFRIQIGFNADPDPDQDPGFL